VSLTNKGTIAGTEGSVNFYQSRADTVINDGHLDGLARLGGGGDVYYGEGGWVTGAVWGQGGDDLLVGGARGDVLAGGSGDDTLTGGAGADKLTGAAGADRLSGGTGDDVFRFAAAADADGDAIVASDGTLAFRGAGESLRTTAPWPGAPAAAP
jgi:Ca2+-binding RTX toxin-like protein